MRYDNVSKDYDSFIPVEDKRILEGVYEKLREKYAPQLKELDEMIGE